MKCSNCQSTSLKKHLVRKNKKGDKNVYKCAACTKISTQDPFFHRMRSEKEMILQALQLYNDGFSYGKIEKKLEKKVNKSTIFRWVKRYAKFVE